MKKFWKHFKDKALNTSLIITIGSILIFIHARFLGDNPDEAWFAIVFFILGTVITPFLSWLDYKGIIR